MDESQLLHLLANGEFDLEGRIAWGSNYTLIGRVCLDQLNTVAIYKPQRGERPLWDFPSGTLCRRECAAYLISKQLGWQLVPPTILRSSVYGLGSFQLFIEHDPNIHYFHIEEDEQFRAQLQRFVAFDIITNNADRKAGHVLVDDNDHLWAIDHGLCFHDEPKLRTVIWEFANRPIPASIIKDISNLEQQLKHGKLDQKLQSLLNTREISALQRRTSRLIKTGVFPEPSHGRHYPWPPV